MKTRYLSLFLFIFSGCISTNLQPQSNINKPTATIIEEEKIQFVNFVFSDLLGNLKEITIPAKYALAKLEEGLFFDGSSVPGCTEIFQSDMFLKPDLDTFSIIPWTNNEEKTALVLCEVYRDEMTPYEADPRHILKKVTAEARQMGFEFFVGPELEFFLFKSPDFCDNSTTPCDEKGYIDAEKDIYSQVNKFFMINMLKRHNINVEKLHHEVAPGQHEIVIKHGDALSIADQVTLAKHAVKSLAKNSGLQATFMPKPLYGKNGSGMHVHFSLFNTHEQKNTFYSENSSDYLSETAHYFIAGVLHRVREITALLNPTVNSYKRLVPGYEAPIYICWGTKNRSALIRIPQCNENKPAAARAEIRSPDPSCNPYLAFAALLKAGLEGIKNKEQLSPIVEENLYKMTQQQIVNQGIESLPSSLDEAIVLLENSSFIKEFFGTRFLSEYLKTKKAELRSFATAVTDWELHRYL